MDKVNVTIIGAGAVGLAAAFELSGSEKDIFVIEKNDSFGRETSSRNSEVIHAGMYYPQHSLKAKTCVMGRELLYDFCTKNNVPFKKIGKLIVATDKDEIAGLEKISTDAIANGIADLKFLSRAELKKIEPNVTAEAALYSPSTGIIDSHSFMKQLAAIFRNRGGQISYNAEVVGINKMKEGFEITVRDASGENFKFLTRILINSAGLWSDKISSMAGIDKDEYKLKYCKGSYFRVAEKKANFIQRLIYPLPEKYRTGLGIHATLNMAGGMRIGPDTEYVNEPDYGVNEAKKTIFCNSVKKFLPFIEIADLSPDTAGVRPKLQGPGEGFRDFIIRNETANGIPGLINLIGIESPGLTASMAIAKMVKELV
ncbi:MAG: NAD(P)/FAD-dependent oxidoreductase [Candidatus Omnitrophota bacterium]